MTTPNVTEEENVQSLSEKLSTFAVKNSQDFNLIMEQLKIVVNVNQQLSERITSIESNVTDSQALRTPPDAPTKKPLSKKNLKKFNVKVEHKNDPFKVNSNQFKELAYGSDDSDKSEMSCVSNITNEEDLHIISALTKNGYQNTAQSTKDQKSQLLKIQERYRLQIPKLKHCEAGADLPPTHNYGVWIKKLLKYYTVLSPQLARAVKTFLSQVDIDEILSVGASSANAPELSEEDYPLIMRLSAMGALTDSLDGDFADMVTDSLTDIFPSLVNIMSICAPNSQEDRTDTLSDFFSLRHQNETLFKFKARLVDYSEKINNQYDTEQISQEQVYSAFISGVKKGENSSAYLDALKILKFKAEKSPSLHAHVLWLHRNCDHSKLIKKSLDNVSGHDANALRSRGGKGRGGRGGRGGRKGKGKGKGKGSYNPPAGTTTWKDTYYAVTDAEGEDTVTKPVPETQTSKPCFTFIKDGQCNTPDCPFNHEFNIVDLRKPSEKSSNASQKKTTEWKRVETEKDSAPEYPAQVSASSVQDAFVQDEDPFDYAYEMGFKHSVSCATSKNYNYSKTTSNSNFSLFSCGNKFSSLLSLLFILLCQFLTTIFSFSDILLYIYLYLFDSLFNINISISLSLSDLLNTLSTNFYLPNYLPTMGNLSIPCTLTENIRFVSNIISPPSYNFLLLQLQSGVEYFLHFMSCSPLSLYIFLLVIVLSIDGRLFKSPIKLFAFGGSVRQAIYKIILDCGCTFTMSGDENLFIKSTLVAIDESVGLAESGYSSKATHRGKILIDNKPIDALLVPDFKQTMVSMGQLERMGLTMTSSGTVRNFVTNKGDTFLSFYMAPNNLYPLLPSKDSTSSSSSAPKSKSN